ncbi:diacylglycerol kinase 3-like [Impatiens glandulifera]|uniref:diacylglycerol kinase 3-like n=1 Tax=Impatiens glandulifera TaxID=253017 RepID=UPI001FB05937|nr:diacylglycerol kinase 3-like [Impatiens glandulifera]
MPVHYKNFGNLQVAGGNSAVGWVLGLLGTGNDLSRTFGWGGSILIYWNFVVKKTLDNACTGKLCRLNSWKLSMSMPDEKLVDPPYSLKLEQILLHQTLWIL